MTYDKCYKIQRRKKLTIYKNEKHCNSDLDLTHRKVREYHAMHFSHIKTKIRLIK